MPPARGLGSPPDVGGLRDAGGTGVGGPGLAPDAGGADGGGEPAAPAGPTKLAGSGSFSEAARARTAADTAGLERGAGVCTALPGPAGWEGFAAGAAGGEAPVPAEPTRVPGEGVRTGGEPGAGTFDPGGPPP